MILSSKEIQTASCWVVVKSKSLTSFHNILHHLPAVADLVCGSMTSSTMAPVMCAKLLIMNVYLVKLTSFVMGWRYGVLYNISLSICNYLHDKNINMYKI